jgi:hypothetical protein
MLARRLEVRGFWHGMTLPTAARVKVIFSGESGRTEADRELKNLGGLTYFVIELSGHAVGLVLRHRTIR